MNNKDVLDMLKRTYSDNAPDVLHNLDFNKIEKEEAKVIPIRRKYYTAAAIYAAACLVVVLILPFIIGDDDPAPTPGVVPYNSETAVTGDDLNNTVETEAEPHPDDNEIIDEFMAALDRAVAEGEVEDHDYDRENLRRLGDKSAQDTDVHAFMFVNSYLYTFVYFDNEVYQIKGPDLPVYMAHSVQYCNIDRNGKDDLLIYGTWGSGVYGYGLSYFDSNTKTVTDLFVGAFKNVYIEETGEDDDIKYNIYARFLSGNGVYIGTLEYENGEVVTNLIREGTINEVVDAVLDEIYGSKKKYA